MAFLERNTDVDIVGGQVQLFRDNEVPRRSDASALASLAAVPPPSPSSRSQEGAVARGDRTTTRGSRDGGDWEGDSETEDDSETEALAGPASRRRTTSFPLRPLRAHWRMFFSCCLAHPAVMLRRSVLAAARLPAAATASASPADRSSGDDDDGDQPQWYRQRPFWMPAPPNDDDGGEDGADNNNNNNNIKSPPATTTTVNVAHVEDYELWLRLLEGRRRRVTVANVNCVVLLLRKHGGNVSSVHASAQQDHRAAVSVSRWSEWPPECDVM